MKKVVITGLGCISALGNNVDSLIVGFDNGISAVKKIDDWSKYKGLQSLVGAPAFLENVKNIPRKKRRSMGRMSIMATQASQEALKDAEIDEISVSSDRVGCIIGSTMGGAEAMTETFETMLPDRDLTLLTSMKFFQCVSHTAAMNVAQFFGIKGNVMATSAACASSLQALGVGVDLIRAGKQDVVLCGGAEELHPTVTGSFDILFATSTHFNDKPSETPRPFDAKRDGLVCGEGCGIIVIEEYEHALARGAKIYAEIIGHNTCGSGIHVSQSNHNAMIQCLNSALNEAEISPSDVDYVCAHATATIQGDAEEVKAIKELFGENIPVSSLKGYIGHTLGASGSIELIVALYMMKNGIIYPTLNLENVADDCKGIYHVKKLLKKDINIFVKNCFAFGGINATLICKKLI